MNFALELPTHQTARRQLIQGATTRNAPSEQKKCTSLTGFMIVSPTRLFLLGACRL